MSSPPISPPRPRRRSSFFDRRDSLQPTSTKTDKQIFLDKLEAEAAAWKQLYRDKIAIQTSLKRELDRPDDRIPRPNDAFLYDLISDDVAAFLRKKPDLKEAKNDAMQFCKECDCVSAIYVQYMEDEERIAKYLASSIKSKKDYILNYSTIQSD